MVRYIDADKTLQLMWNALYQYEDDIEKKNGLNTTERLDVQNGFEIAHKVVVDAPAEDVAPVIHAHWKEFEDYSGTVYPECSRCGLVWWLEEGTAEDNEMYYCPKCGAKMDEEAQV